MLAPFELFAARPFGALAPSHVRRCRIGRQHCAPGEFT
jgi:hypothetical protein